MSENHFPNRQSIRQPFFDYRQSGAYFITVCTHKRDRLFGQVKAGIMHLSDIGRKVDQVWHDIPNRFPWVKIDAFQIMPDHIHGIIWIEKRGGRGESHSPDIREPKTPNRENIGNAGEWDSPLQQPGGYQRPRGTSKTVGSVVRGLKIPVTQWVRQSTHIHNVWQRNFYDEIIRTQQALDNIRRYILNNPRQWQIDHDRSDISGIWH